MTTRERESAVYSFILERALTAKDMAVALRSPQTASLPFLAKEFGIVPCPSPRFERCNTCRHTRRVNMLAASVLRYRAAHALPGSIYGETAWAEARRCTR